MKWAIQIVWLLLIPAAATAVVEEEQIREIVETKYAQMNKALVGKDLGALTAICTADCKFKVRPGGVSLSLDQFKRFQEQGFKTLTVNRARTTVDSIQVQGDRATIRATWIADLTAKKGKSARKLRGVQKLQDTWSHEDEVWRLSASTVMSTRTSEISKPSRARL